MSAQITPLRSLPDSAANPADRELAALAKALAHPARVRILRFLLERGECICGDICDELPLAQSTVSQHLKILRSAGLIQGTVDGPRVCYCANPRELARLHAGLGALLKGELEP